MKFSCPLPWTGPNATPDNLRRMAKLGESLGFDYVAVGEHLVYPKRLEAKYPFSPDGLLPIDPSAATTEIFTTLAFLAAETTRIRLHSGIVVLPYRSPFEAAKLAATVDYLSNGRFTFGIGVGWMKDEFDLLKVPFAERGKITDDGIKLMRALFDGAPRYDGVYHSFVDVHFAPKPVQKPLPIWIGGNADGAIRRAATLAQGWAPGLPLETLIERRKLLDDLRAKAGRAQEPFAIASGLGAVQPGKPLVRFSQNKAMVEDTLAAFARAGITHVNVMMNELNAPEPLAALCEEVQWFAETILPQARGL